MLQPGHRDRYDTLDFFADVTSGLILISKHAEKQLVSTYHREQEQGTLWPGKPTVQETIWDRLCLDASDSSERLGKQVLLTRSTVRLNSSRRKN